MKLLKVLILIALAVMYNCQFVFHSKKIPEKHKAGSSLLEEISRSAQGDISLKEIKAPEATINTFESPEDGILKFKMDDDDVSTNPESDDSDFSIFNKLMDIDERSLRSKRSANEEVLDVRGNSVTVMPFLTNGPTDGTGTMEYNGATVDGVGGTCPWGRVSPRPCVKGQDCALWSNNLVDFDSLDMAIPPRPFGDACDQTTGQFMRNQFMTTPTPPIVPPGLHPGDESLADQGETGDKE